MASEDSSETDRRKEEFEIEVRCASFDPNPLAEFHNMVKFSEREIRLEKGKEHPDRRYIAFCYRMRRRYIADEMAFSSMIFSGFRNYRV